jgi:hypothetical protein
VSDDVVCTWDGCDRTFETTRAMRIHHRHVHGEPEHGRHCEHCDELFTPKVESQTHCSTACYSAAHRETLTCEQCGEAFDVPQSMADERVYCSQQCKFDGHGGWGEGRSRAYCDHCGKHFNTYEPDERRFCSQRCRGEGISNRDPTDLREFVVTAYVAEDNDLEDTYRRALGYFDTTKDEIRELLVEMNLFAQADRVRLERVDASSVGETDPDDFGDPTDGLRTDGGDD